MMMADQLFRIKHYAFKNNTKKHAILSEHRPFFKKYFSYDDEVIHFEIEFLYFLTEFFLNRPSCVNVCMIVQLEVVLS